MAVIILNKPSRNFDVRFHHHPRARLHNLKNISLSIPKNQLVVLSGVSGSGKSTLGFDILFKEGQRQYMEALGLLTWGLAKPPVDSISGLPPTVSLYRQPGSHSPRSTVGTLSEVYTHLRVLYARLGERPCPHCGETIPPIFDAPEGDWEDESDTTARDDESLPCPHCKKPVPLLSMGHFSFNKPLGACPTCTGLGTLQQANLSRLLDVQKSLLSGAVFDWNEQLIRYHSGVLAAAALHYGFDFDLNQPVKDYTQAQRDLLLFGVESERFRHHFQSVEPPTTVSRGRFEGIATSLLRRYAQRIQDAAYREKLDELLLVQTCPDCQGTRLRPESRAVTLHGQPISALASLPLTELADWLKELPAHLSPAARQAARPMLDELDERIARLLGVGVGYLALERSAPSLSAGEAQRLALASLLGSSLSGVLYVFDEPTIGLHPRDTQRLIEVLCRLRELGNSVLVIEHDLEVMRAADYLVDFGPGAGRGGGQVVASGTPHEVAAHPASLTGAYLSGRMKLPVPQPRRAAGDKLLTIRGAREHNLKAIDVSIPLGSLVAVSGVSGSGKSTLIFDTLDRALRQHLYGASQTPGAHDAIEGMQHIAQVITIDQAQLGTLPRSNAATYSDTFTPIREAFALHRGCAADGHHPAAFLLQRARRALRALPGRRRAAGEDALPAGCRGALPGMPRAALHPRDPGGALSRLRHRPGAGADHRGSAGAVCRLCRQCARACRCCATSGWATCSSASRLTRSPAAKRSASSWRRSWGGGTPDGRSTCSTSPPPVCTWRISPACWACCSAWWLAAAAWW